jgi:hypothetical protein
LVIFADLFQQLGRVVLKTAAGCPDVRRSCTDSNAPTDTRCFGPLSVLSVAVVIVAMID